VKTLVVMVWLLTVSVCGDRTICCPDKYCTEEVKMRLNEITNLTVLSENCASQG